MTTHGRGASGAGARGFPADYWEANYSHPELMDGIQNAASHADYLSAFFALSQVEIRSLADFGFGPAVMLRAMIERFRPYKVIAIEPSSWAFQRVLAHPLSGPTNMRVALEQTDLVSWARHPDHPRRRADLGICTSVLQYLGDSEILEVLPVLSRRVRFLYLTVPTDIDLDRQIAEEQFHDPWAIRRSREVYRAWLAPHFAFVSSRILESRTHYNDRSTPCDELLFRF